MTRRWRGCWNDERRAARRLAPLRGLRPLSLHPGSDQERDPDPARDRLPAGLRRSQSRRRGPRCGSRSCSSTAPKRSVSGSVRFLQASGERHQGVERTIELPPVAVGELAEEPVGGPFEFDGERRIQGRVRMRAEPLGDGVARVKLCVHNTTELEGDGDVDRTQALLASLISTHVVLRAADGRFISPIENDGPRAEAVAGCENVNTWPVLASPEDDVVLGAAMFLPDHPRIAPESLGSLFDNTEIEEALLLHVQTLSEEERGRDRRPGPEGPRDDRARRAGDPGGDDRPPRAAGAGAPAVRRARGDRRREDDQARARGLSCGHARRGATPTTRSSPGAGRRSSGSTSTTTTRSTSASPSTTTRARS